MNVGSWSAHVGLQEASVKYVLGLLILDHWYISFMYTDSCMICLCFRYLGMQILSGKKEQKKMRARVRQPLGPPFRQLGNGPCSSMETKPKYIATREIFVVSIFFSFWNGVYLFVLSFQLELFAHSQKKKELGRFAKCVWLCDIQSSTVLYWKTKRSGVYTWDPGSSSMFIQHLPKVGTSQPFTTIKWR